MNVRIQVLIPDKTLSEIFNEKPDNVKTTSFIQHLIEIGLSEKEKELKIKE